MVPDSRRASNGFCQLSVNGLSITVTSLALAAIIGVPVNLFSAAYRQDFVGNAEMPIGASVFSVGFLLSFIGFTWNGITHSTFSRNIGTAGLLFMCAAVPTSMILVLFYGPPVFSLRIWGSFLLVCLFDVMRRFARWRSERPCNH